MKIAHSNNDGIILLVQHNLKIVFAHNSIEEEENDELFIDCCNFSLSSKCALDLNTC